MLRSYLHKCTGSESLVVLLPGLASSLIVSQNLINCVPTGMSYIILEPPLLHIPSGNFKWWGIPEEGEEKDLIHQQSQAAFLKLTATLTEIKREFPEFKTIHAIGFSQGAALLSEYLRTASDFFDKVALISGFVRTISKELSKSNCSTKIFLIHGQSDEIVPNRFGEELYLSLKKIAKNIEYQLILGDHWLPETNVNLIKEFLSNGTD